MVGWLVHRSRLQATWLAAPFYTKKQSHFLMGHVQQRNGFFEEFPLQFTFGPLVGALDSRQKQTKRRDEEASASVPSHSQHRYVSFDMSHDMFVLISRYLFVPRFVSRLLVYSLDLDGNRYVSRYVSRYVCSQYNKPRTIFPWVTCHLNPTFCLERKTAII